LKALLLAAGSGSRLGAGVPKILVKVAGVSILHRHLRSLALLGVLPGDVTVVTGFCDGLLSSECTRAGTGTVFNPEWRDPGTCSSFRVHEPVSDELLILHGDLVWNAELVAPLQGIKGDVVIPFDPLRRTDAEAMKAEVREGRLLHLSKRLPPFRSAGESMGAFLVRDHYRLHGISHEFSKNPCASLDDCLNAAAGRMDIRVFPVCGVPWEEVDTPADRARAEEVFHGR
jgi:L-glutamine-phosphate cytidylyltransferase